MSARKVTLGDVLGEDEIREAAAEDMDDALALARAEGFAAAKEQAAKVLERGVASGVYIGLTALAAEIRGLKP